MVASKKTNKFVIGMSSLLLMAALSSCNNNEGTITTKTVTKEVAGPTVNTVRTVYGNILSAADYADIGEAIIQGRGDYLQADKLFKQALLIDSKNDKALFYSSFSQLSVRLEELVDDNFEINLDKFKTTQAGQDFFRTKILPEVLASIKSLDLIANDVDLKINDKSIAKKACQAQSSNGACLLSLKSSKNKITKKILDKSDIKIIKNAFMAVADHIRLGSAYSSEGLEAIQKELKNMKNKTPQKVVSVLRKQEKFLTLVDADLLPDTAHSLQDLLRNVISLSEMEQELCKNDSRSVNVIKTLCIAADAVKKVSQGIDLLAGEKEITLGSNGKKDVRIKIDLSMILNQPIQDMKELLPTEFDAQGEVTEYPDTTAGGLFPNGDIVEKLKELGQIK